MTEATLAILKDRDELGTELGLFPIPGCMLKVLKKNLKKKTYREIKRATLCYEYYHYIYTELKKNIYKKILLRFHIQNRVKIGRKRLNQW